MNTERVVIEARKTSSGGVEFSPTKFYFDGYDLRTKALGYDVEGDRLWFVGFMRAHQIALIYEEGLGDDVRSARWNSRECRWDDVEYSHVARTRGDREDFHVDG